MRINCVAPGMLGILSNKKQSAALLIDRRANTTGKRGFLIEKSAARLMVAVRLREGKASIHTRLSLIADGVC